MGTLLEKVAYAIQTKAFIRQKANLKGASITTGTTFRAYADAIANLLVASDVITPNDSNAPNTLSCAVWLPEKTPDGTLIETLNCVFPTGSTSGFRVSELHLPVTVTSLQNAGNVLSTNKLEVLEGDGLTNISGITWGAAYTTGLRKISLRAYSGNVHSITPNQACEVILPAIVSYNLSSTTAVNLPEGSTVDYSALTSARTNSNLYPAFIKKFTIEDKFPVFAEAKGYAFKLRDGSRLCLPSLTWAGGNSASSDADNFLFESETPSDIHIYIGANLSTFTTANATALSTSGVTVHIPAGASTTKTTLDAKGVSYVQDYITE